MAARSRPKASEGVKPEMPSGDSFVEMPEVVKEAHEELDRLIASLESVQFAPAAPAKSADVAGNTKPPEGSGPIYLIVSSKSALTAKYGELGFDQIDNYLRELKEAVGRHRGLKAVILYVDDDISVATFGLAPVDPSNPWRIKTLIDNLDARAAEVGEEVRHLLIVGGDDIIPFHRLPNPIDDQDPNVLSDNPYACRDGNYLIQERAIGRMPDGTNEGLSFLHAQISTAVEGHRKRSIPKGLFSSLTSALHSLQQVDVNHQGLGYSASIWRKASRAVFRVIGDDSRLRMCPPLTYEGFKVTGRPHFSYFNLHGIEDGPNWYGQRDTLFPADYPLFPLALRPQDLSIKEHANSVVLTEACYGANILGKNTSNSIALQFLASQALAVVGSTKVAYGSIAPPLLGADLIGRYFWEGIRARMTAGEALQYAKVSLAREMQERQGYLDGEDQKALISFVLYGDPALPITTVQGGAPVRSQGKGFCPPIVCSQENTLQKGGVSEELVTRVKARIEMSLPHMSQASVRAKPLPDCVKDCDNQCGALKRGHHGERSGLSTGKARKKAGGWAFTLRKEIPVRGERSHHQVVKVTVDEQGHILKMAISK